MTGILSLKWIFAVRKSKGIKQEPFRAEPRDSGTTMFTDSFNSGKYNHVLQSQLL